MPRRPSAIAKIQIRVAVERERDIERVRSGIVSAADVGRENGAFGRAIANSGALNWRRPARVA